MKYLTNSFEASKNQNSTTTIVFSERQLATPKNVVNATAFEAVFSTVLENTSLQRLTFALEAAKEAENTEEVKILEAAISVFESSRHEKSFPSEKDSLFYTALKWIVLGLEKHETFEPKTKEGTFYEAIETAMKKAVSFVHDNKAIPANDMKILKELFNNFCNKYLATTNESGVFKNFHVAFSTKSIMHIVMMTEQRIKWGKEKLDYKALKTDKILLEALAEAALVTFKFEAKKAKKAPQKVTV